MIKSLRNKFISVLTLIACVMFAMLIGVSANFVKAADAVDTNVFTMYNTASIRTDKDPAGIRFGAQLGLEKFKALAGTEEGASINVVFTANKAGADVRLEKTKTYTVTAEDFANDEDGIINIMYTLTFDNAWDDAKKQEAYAMSLTVGCKAYKGETEVADLGTMTQDARSVASFNDLIDETEAYKGYYYTSAKMVDGVAPYVAGTKIYVDGATAGSSVYINTVKVNAEIADGFVTIKEADMADLLTTVSKNIIQVIDADGNVLAKELTEEIPVVDGGYFSVKDGYTVEGAVEATIIANDADEDGAFDTLSVENGVINGLTTIKGDALTNVTIRVATETETKDITVKAATKIIDDASDLTSVYNGSTTTTGYFFVANNIEFDKDVTISPTITALDKGSHFSGVFDGNGHTIEYGVVKGGLFGNLLRATIKNVKLIVRSVPDSYSSYSHAIIAGYSKYSTLINVYASYQLLNEKDEVINFEAGKTNNNSGKNYRYGLGLFSATQTDGTGYASIFTNVIVDMSKVVMDTDQTNDDFGVFGAPTLNSNFGTFTNCYVIWTEKLIANAKHTWTGTVYKYILAYTEEDKESYNESYTTKYGESSIVSKHLLDGISRYDTLKDMVGDADNITVGNFVVTATGVTWKNN